MRRLGMRNKRRKSGMSDTESEENGDYSRDERSAGRRNNNDESASESSMETMARKSPIKRRSRGTVSQDKSDGEAKDESNVRKAIERNNKSSPNKRKKKEDQRASTSTHAKNDNEYEVEKIIGCRTFKGSQQFLIRWKGYNKSSDSWENEHDLNCLKLMEDFLMKEKNKVAKATKTKPTDKPKIHKVKKAKGSTKKQTEDEKQDDAVKDKDNLKEFEVEKILEVHFKKNGTREFLIRWKGFNSTDDTWEPEINLNCPELIAKFMQKLEKVKTADVRELRTNPVHTKRYTLSTPEHGRRLSRRHMDKQRATYHECDD